MPTVEVTGELAELTGWRALHPLAGCPPCGGVRGRGLWMVRQICDRIEIHPGGGRTTVRMHLQLRP